MVYDKIGYHGTSRNDGISILSQGMRMTRGDYHWLGDGAYFFTEPFHAFKWIYDNWKKSAYAHQPLEKNFCIIQVILQTDSARVFDLTTVPHKLEYDEVLKGIEQVKPRGIWANRDTPEGVVLNYMFNVLNNYQSRYDIVKAQFCRRKGRYSSIINHVRNVSNSPCLFFLPQMIVCVKNTNALKSPAGYNIHPREAEFISYIGKYNEALQPSEEIFRYTTMPKRNLKYGR